MTDTHKLARLKKEDVGIGKVLKYMENLNEVNTNGVEPTIHPVDIKKNVFRKDVVKPSLTQGEALSNAPKRKGAYFCVPKII